MKPETDMLSLFVVYENPSDYPGQFVVRQQVVINGSVYGHKEPLAVHENYEEVINRLPPLLFRTERFPDDDPCIKEVWL